MTLTSIFTRMTPMLISSAPFLCVTWDSREHLAICPWDKDLMVRCLNICPCGIWQRRGWRHYWHFQRLVNKVRRIALRYLDQIPLTTRNIWYLADIKHIHKQTNYQDNLYFNLLRRKKVLWIPFSLLFACQYLHGCTYGLTTLMALPR